MFKKSDLETIVISVLTNNPNTFYNQSALFNQLINSFLQDELFVGHFLFVWEKLLLNTNFIEQQILENYVMIKIKNFNNDELQPHMQILEPLTVNINKLIKHMIKYPELYKGPKIINTFLLKVNNYSNKYDSVYDILSDTKLIEDPTDSIQFINMYFNNIDSLITNPVHKYTLLKKHENTQQIITPTGKKNETKI
jgi:hypothetical protein